MLIRAGLALAAGLVFALGQAPFGLWFIAGLALPAVMMLFARSASAVQAGWIGWLFGLGYFGLSLGWITEPFMVDAARDGWMAPFALVGLAGGLALLWAAPFWAARKLPRPGMSGRPGRAGGTGGAGGFGRSDRLAALVLGWSVVELARAYLLTGFPWGLVGYLWIDTPVIQWVAILGPHGLTLLTLALAAWIAAAILDRAPVQLGLGGIGVALLLMSGLLLHPPLQDLRDRPVVRLVQPNAPQHQKWDPAHVPTFFNRQVAFTAAGDTRPDLVVWPETAIPMLVHQAAEAFDIISDAAGGVPVVLGAQRAERGRFYNSLVVLGAGGAVEAIYDKHHLVPFGEYMPAAGFFARFDVAGLAARAAGGYAAGLGPRILGLGRVGNALPLICYEAVFPQDVRGPAARPDLLLQITNDAWFGTRSGPYQHLAQARVRAIEQALPMVRAANTGVSAVIDPAGRILASLPLGKAGYLDHPLPAPGAPTLYTRTGDWGVLVLILLLASGLMLRTRQNRD